ncbi:hypothetical protein GTA08_BOTSDO03652 [Botryosphaeria dothidea]|uniref:Uncharacterized protein n=1 Tax=Botryosphaeria dothidea TaxID=55169 RepID=A0A8H4IWE0_9PEZI|nr:hypothetical protein GTA08_BOTSDO03652 [Botryosphaeria dothidea]
MLILMTLNCATSAHGPWNSHLTRAYTIFEAASGLSATLRVPRARAQIEMLVWWDVTLALTSRKGYVMPESYVSRLFADDTAESFYNMSGCPFELFRHMVRLAQYAREFELATTMTCVTFRRDLVLGVERCIREWSAEGYGDVCAAVLRDEDTGARIVEEDRAGGSGTMEEKANARQDLYYCAEAWRYALLLYVERVFKWDRTRPPSPVLGLIARKTLDHIWSCRRSSMVQKQLLLPAFLAGCETKDSTLRELASDYCAWWTEKTRHEMFATTSLLLEEVWASKSEKSWWGSVIDEKSRSGAVESFPHQYLFG